jgi:hypothetical protein
MTLIACELFSLRGEVSRYGVGECILFVSETSTVAVTIPLKCDQRKAQGTHIVVFFSSAQ